MVENTHFLSRTLQAISKTKQHEQSKRHKSFEARKASIIEATENAKDARSKLTAIISGFNDLPFGNKGVAQVDDGRKRTLDVMNRCLEQSEYDPSISPALLEKFQEDSHQRLDRESERFRLADLYFRFLTEWTDTKSTPLEKPEEEEGLGESFEHVKYTLQDLRENFSEVVFTPLETDEVEIDNYLDSLFDDEHAQKSLAHLRKKVEHGAGELKKRSAPFSKEVVTQCIQALQANSVLSDDAKMTLAEFSGNEDVLSEIADVLNLRFADIDNWAWEADGGMYYEPRKQINGKYRIMMDQDILQAIFLHYIAVSWSQILKPEFRSLVGDADFWKGLPPMSKEDKARYNYFFETGVTRMGETVNLHSKQRDRATGQFLLSSMPDCLADQTDPYGGDENTGLVMRQTLLRQIASDVLIRQKLYGTVAVVQSDLKWYATGLPHSTLLAVQRFWGVPEDWLAFFKKFAEAPLRMDPTPGENVRTRKRGIPITEAFENLFGECVLFCMDVAVNRISEASLFRFHDDLWLYGDPSVCARAWETINVCVNVLGLEINKSKTGSIYISPPGEQDPKIASTLPDGQVCVGMLQLTETGDWTIDQTQVSSHARQLKKQLAQTTSILSWVQIWNACMGTFFPHVFGEPATCFGRAHVTQILATFAQLQTSLFASHNGSVTSYLREKIQTRFGVSNVPDAFLYLPEACGGLGLQNPFISFSGLNAGLEKSPERRVQDFLAKEKDDYEIAKRAFDARSTKEHKDRFASAFASVNATSSVLSEPFPAFDVYTSFRLYRSFALYGLFRRLTGTLNARDVPKTVETAHLFEALKASHGVEWGELGKHDQWVLGLYAGELERCFGGLSVVDRNMLPGGSLKMMKGSGKAWQLVHWD